MSTSDRFNHLSLPDLYRAMSAGGLVRRLLELARDEDLGPRRLDVTSAVSVPAEAKSEGVIVARAPGVICGLACLHELMDVYGTRVDAHLAVQDGKRVEKGTVLATLRGPKREILAVERPALNLIGRLSGVATTAAAFVMAVGEGTRAKIYDTRKTMPGMRVLEKYATRCGGAMCHRVGLFDAVLIKDTHLAGVGLETLAGVVAGAARQAKTMNGDLSCFEVEVETLDQLARVLTIEPGLVDVVLLDNMSPIQLRKGVAMRDAAKNGAKVQLEASGGIRLDTVRTIAESGVERISAGAITHSAPWFDVALDMKAGGA
jgi:nicotinate-nucleotide pyrophosphorylase (carboxylating)